MLLWPFLTWMAILLSPVRDLGMLDQQQWKTIEQNNVLFKFYLIHQRDRKDHEYTM